MKNWSYYKKGWSISWYNFKNELDDSYAKTFNEAYKNNPDKYFKKVFHLMWKEYGIEYVHMWNTSHLLWQTPKNIYWFKFRVSDRFDKKGKWKFKVMKTTNDHVSCG